MFKDEYGGVLYHNSVRWRYINHRLGCLLDLTCRGESELHTIDVDNSCQNLMRKRFSWSETRDFNYGGAWDISVEKRDAKVGDVK